MLNMSLIEIIALVGVLPVLSGIIGYFVAMNRVRRQTGGKTPMEIKRELEDYRLGVTAHFHQTAELMEGMTEQYRAIYTHLARGASELCVDSDPGPHLAQFEAGLLEESKPDIDAHDEVVGGAEYGGDPNPVRSTSEAPGTGPDDSISVR